MPARDTSPLDTALDPMPDAPVCVALSGGLDSATLLDVLARRCSAQSRPLRAVHVHHGLSAHADAWAVACAAMCASAGVALTVRRVVVATREGGGVEAAARDARRAAFADVLEPGDVLALAHHRDDQAETFLLRALRGSGTDGLGAMHAWQPFARGHLWRPWLELSRDAIERHAALHGLHWIEDDSNADARFDRNYLRRHVMPLLRERWPHAGAALAMSAAHCRDATALLRDEDARALDGVRTPDPQVLSISALRAVTPLRLARVLRAWTTSLGLPPLPRVGVERIAADLLSARTDASASFDWHGASVRAWRDLMHAGRTRAPLAAAFVATWGGDDVFDLPDGGRLQLEGAVRLDAPVQVRARTGGERITLPGRSHSHALKHVVQDRAIAPWTRAHLPLLFAADGELLAAGDLIQSDRFDAWMRTTGARLIWTPPRD